MKTLGYLNLVQINENARNILRQLLVLPLLPEPKIVQEFRIIKIYARRCLIDMNSLFDYYERYVFNYCSENKLVKLKMYNILYENIFLRF